MNDKEFYTAEEAAKLLGCSVYTVRDKIRDGIIEASRVPTKGGQGRLRISNDEIIRLLNIAGGA